MAADNRETVNTVDKELCCGCRTCEQVCPVSAIHMVPDECGFIYPTIDDDACIHCGRCLNSCAFQSGYERRNEFDPYYGYGIRHQDDAKIMKSRSGAAFVAFSDAVLKQGGVVVGAGYDSSSTPFAIVHKLASDQEGRDEFCGAKYVQSDMQDVFPQVKAELEQGKEVLFSGTGCQVGALHKYLGREYDNLVTADIICHGVQSPKLWADYMRHCEEEFGANIEEVDFRNKRTFGWGRVHVESYKAGGTEHFSVRFSKLYGLSFSRPSCFVCPYCNNERPGDLTLGDFWGHEKALADLWDDQKGISLVLVNTKKGADLLDRAREDLLVVDCTGHRFQHKHLKEPVDKPGNYDEFWTDYAEQGLEYCLDKYVPQQECQDRVNSLLKTKAHFDAGLVVFAANNYGSCATNVALYHALKDLGLSPIILDTLAVPDGISHRYMRTYLTVSSDYTRRDDADWANKACDSFFIGSDQCWRFSFGRFKESLEYFLLAFTSDDKRRISYGSSFGMERYDLDEDFRLVFKNLLGRFHAVSVREDYAVNMCMRLFGVRSRQVADPVFLLSKDDYAKMAESSQINTDGDYLLAYILEPSAQKRDLLRSLATRLQLPLHVMCDAKKYKQNAEFFDMEEIVPMPEFEDWIKYLVNAKHVVTDSFHGTCFSLILQKDCTVIKARVTNRFDSLANYFCECNEEDRPKFFESVEEASEEVYSARADSAAIADVLAGIREDSLEWLKAACNIEVRASGPDMRDMWMHYARLKKKDFGYKYDYEESVKARYEELANKKRTHLRVLRAMYHLPGRQEKPFLKESLASAVFQKLRNEGLEKYTLILSCKESCSTYWKEFLKVSKLPLMRHMERRQSYYAIVCGGKNVAECASKDPLDLRVLLRAPAGSKAMQSFGSESPIELGAKKVVSKWGICARLGQKPVADYVPLVVSIHSMHTDMVNKSHKSSIQINNVDYALNQRGINIVIVENRSGCVVDTFSIDLHGDARLAVRRQRQKYS